MSFPRVWLCWEREARTDHPLSHPESMVSLLSRGRRVGWRPAFAVSRFLFVDSDRERRAAKAGTHRFATLCV